MTFVDSAGGDRQIGDNFKDTSNAALDKKWEEDFKYVKKEMSDPKTHDLLQKMESLGMIHDIARYGLFAVENYVRGWEESPSLLQSDDSPREMTFSTNLEYQFDRKKQKELIKVTTGEGIGYETIVGQEDVPMPSATNAQFDFAQVTPLKKRVKHRNIMGEDGQVLDVTSMDEEQIKIMFS